MGPGTPRGIPIWVVDAFTTQAFQGNPAAVCLIQDGTDLDDAAMCQIAAEMRHSETAYVRRLAAGRHQIRWWTPTREVDLCGHATLASAHVLWQHAGEMEDTITFESASGPLVCTRTDHGIRLDFPAAPARPIPADKVPPGLFDALGCAPVPVLAADNGNLLLIFADAEAVASLRPELPALRAVSEEHGYICTAPADHVEADAVCRYFVPAWGIDEDPATGSIQCTLGPYWCDRLGKDEVRVRQTSARGGDFVVRPDAERVYITGACVTLLTGTLA